MKYFGLISPCTVSDLDHPQGRREDLHKESSFPLWNMLQKLVLQNGRGESEQLVCSIEIQSGGVKHICANSELALPQSVNNRILLPYPVNTSVVRLKQQTSVEPDGYSWHLFNVHQTMQVLDKIEMMGMGTEPYTYCCNGIPLES